MKKFENYPLFEIVIDENDDTTGIRLVSIVENPAIEMKGVAFSEEGAVREYEFKAQEDQQMIVGPALIPNKKILRKDADGQRYYTMFRPETIKTMVSKFNRQGTNRRINVDHSTKMVDGYIMENWLVADPYYDKSRFYGFDVPVGTWMVCVKIEDQSFWQSEVKDLGKFGFSVEGIMGERPMEYSSIDDVIDNLSDDEVNELMHEFRSYKIKAKSSNVERMKYDDQTKELIVKFNSGETYTYLNVVYDDFMSVFKGEAACRTEGSNDYGSWYVGKEPSIGAAVYTFLVEQGYRFIYGGDL